MDISIYSGDSRNLIINVVDQNNAIVPLTGASIEWILINNQGVPALSKSVGSGITITSASGGQFTVSITVGDTRSLNGSYQHMARVTTNDGNSSIVLTGTIAVEGSLI